MTDTKMFHRSTVTGFLAVLAGLAGSACGPSGDGADGPQARAEGETSVPAVEVVQAREGSVPLRERLTGTVRAGGQVAIYPQVSGPVVDVMAENGDRVREGDPLVRIRSETSRSQLEQARANLEVARSQARQAEADLEELESQFSRTQALARDSLVSVETLETQRAQVEAARASYNQAQAQVEAARATVEEREEAVGQTVVRAPIEGRVGQRNVEVGMRVDGQTALFTIGRLENMRVRVAIPQEMVSRLQPGQPVEIRTESSSDSLLEGEISRVSPFLEEGSFSARAEIDVANEDGALLPGMFVTVDVFYGETSTSTLVPKSALYDHPDTGQRGVYVVSSADAEIKTASTDGPGKIVGPVEMEFRPAEVHAESRQMVGLRNVDPGSWVVVVGHHLLSDQTREGVIEARIRARNWEQIVGLQRLQRQDLLRQFLERQQQLARRSPDSVLNAITPPAGGSS